MAHWTTYDTHGKSVAGGVVEAAWGADELATSVIGPVEDSIRTVGQFLPGHYQIVLKVYGNRLPESEVRGGFDMY